MVGADPALRDARPAHVESFLIRALRDDALLKRMGPVRLQLEINKHLWSDVAHLNTKKLREWMASYLYLSRLKNSDVLLEAILGGISELFCDNFAYASRYDDETKRYEGLILSGGGMVVIDDLSVVIKPDVAKAQQAAETEKPITGAPAEGEKPVAGGGRGDGTGETVTEGAGVASLPRRFFATVNSGHGRGGRRPCRSRCR